MGDLLGLVILKAKDSEHPDSLLKDGRRYSGRKSALVRKSLTSSTSATCLCWAAAFGDPKCLASTATEIQHPQDGSNHQNIAHITDIAF